MATKRLVLDTNVAGYAPVREIARLAERGLAIRVSEVSFTERLARSFRDHVRGQPVDETRNLLVNRIAAITPFLDPVSPVALGGAHLSRRIEASADGVALPPAGEEWHRLLTALWRVIARGELSDSTWRGIGEATGEQFAGVNAHFKSLCDGDAVELTDVKWEALTDEERRSSHRAMVRKTWAFSDATADRLDAQICATSYRVYKALRGARQPHRNDGVDVALTIHVGEDAILVTNDGKLIDVVDACGTYQRPWVRRLNDLDALPDGPPWGPTAREHAAVFVRRAP